MFKPYEGTLDRRKMTTRERVAYEAFCGLKARSKKAGLSAPEFNAREFMGWWLFNLQSFNGVRPTCGRIDHSKGYSFDNIEMQDMAKNSREMNERTRAAKREKSKGKKVLAKYRESGEPFHLFSSIRETAEYFHVSQRLIQFLVRGKYKSSRVVAFDLEAA